MAAIQSSPVSFKSHHPSFDSVIGPNPIISLLAEDSIGRPLFHEACVYHAPTKSIFVTSNQLPCSQYGVTESPTGTTTRLFRIHDHAPQATSTVEDLTPADLSSSMLNGGVNFDDSSILLCAQGNRDPAHLSGIVQVPIPRAQPQTSGSAPVCCPVISSFYGRPFNSVNDVIVHPRDRSIWFTDPSYGFHQGFRPPPQLPDQVYRYEPRTNSVRAMANGFTRCNGLCFSPDSKLLYVTDTGAIHGSAHVPRDPAGQNHIYVFDVTASDDGSPFLANRRLFAYADGGCPDGIKCDQEGNVFSGCGDGIEVWNSAGVLIGRILVEGGVANFCFGEKGCLYLCNETRFWKVHLRESLRGALLKL